MVVVVVRWGLENYGHIKVIDASLVVEAIKKRGGKPPTFCKSERNWRANPIYTKAMAYGSFPNGLSEACLCFYCSF